MTILYCKMPSHSVFLHRSIHSTVPYEIPFTSTKFYLIKIFLKYSFIKKLEIKNLKLFYIHLWWIRLALFVLPRLLAQILPGLWNEKTLLVFQLKVYNWIAFFLSLGVTWSQFLALPNIRHCCLITSTDRFQFRCG